MTADPTEGEAMFESGCDVIGTVPMPPEIASWIAAFVDRFHVERVFHKRKRDRASGDRPRVPGGRPDEGTGRTMSGPDEADRTRAFWRDGRSASRRQNSRSRIRTPPAGESVGSVRLARTAKGDDVTPEFDLSTLPKLEELTGSTDITAFLRKGVPEHLRNAALQKSWALDPAIRNYVNPALEYAYDWNAPGGVPGGGELGAGVDVARLVSQIMGEPAAETIKSDANCSKDEARRRSGRAVRTRSAGKTAGRSPGAGLSDTSE